MRTVLTIIIGIHGIIHLFGFLKAFDIVKFESISEPISKLYGIVWLLSFILMSTALVLLVNHKDFWWMAGIVGVVLSQFLIILYWKEAQFGTILNFFILVASLIAFSSSNFKKMVYTERYGMLSEPVLAQKEKITDRNITHLPEIVQKWLKHIGVVNKNSIYSVHLEQELQMLMKPGQKKWMDAKANQYFRVDPPAFNWSVDLKMNSFVNVVGRDKFENGEGEMLIKLFSIIPLVNVLNNEKINQAALQRYLAEIIWFPTAALSPYIQWEEIGNHAAKATLTYKGTTGSGIFYFDDEGNFKKLVAMRYKDVNDSEPTEWTVAETRTEKRNGILIPVEAEVSWKLPEGEWTWLKLKVMNAKYNVNVSALDFNS